MTSTTFVSGTTIASAWLNDVNSLVYKAQSGNAGGTDRTALTKLAETVSVKDFGAVGDFNPSTGAGTNDRAAIQAAFTYAMTVTGGCKVVFPPGRYYGGSAAGAYAGGVQIALGDSAVVTSAKNIEVVGYGAELYQGASGRFLGIFGADRVAIRGLKMYGYTGGVLAAGRENDAIITVNYKSYQVLIEDCYLTNGLGDCIYAGGTLASGGLTGYETRNIVIRGNVLKTRYGNGTASAAAGSKSRTAFAFIDVAGADVYDNIIIGSVDLEPNLDSQHITNVCIRNNRFMSGHVTPQAVIGTSYWFDEPVALTGGTEIVQPLTITGVASTPICSGNVVEGNTFENGYVSEYNVYRFERISNNVFQKGQIIIGSTSGSNDTSERSIMGNTFLAPYASEVCAIKLSGFLIGSTIADNHALSTTSAFTYLVYNPSGGSTGDNGRNRYLNNTMRTGTSVVNVGIAATSTEVGSIVSGATNNAAHASLIESNTFMTPLVTITFAGTAQTLNWNTYHGNVWFLSQAATAATSLAQISNTPGDGHMLTVISGANGGGGQTTITHNASFIRLKGAVDAVMTANNTITFVSRAGIWFEISRSF